MESEQRSYTGSLSLLQVSEDIRMAGLDRTNYNMVHPQSGEEGPEQRWANVAAAVLRPLQPCQLRGNSQAKRPCLGKSL